MVRMGVPGAGERGLSACVITHWDVPPCAITETPVKQVHVKKRQAKCQHLGGAGFHTSRLAWHHLLPLCAWSPGTLSKRLAPATCQAQHFPKCPGSILSAASV